MVVGVGATLRQAAPGHPGRCGRRAVLRVRRRPRRRPADGSPDCPGPADRRAGAMRRDAASAVPRSDTPRRSGSLPDRVCRRAGAVRGRTDRGAAPHPGAARRGGGRRRAGGAGRAGRGARHLPADDGGARGGPSDASRALRRAPGHLGGGATNPTRRRPRGGGRHHLGARARVGRGNGRTRGQHRPVHSLALRLAGGRSVADQLPPAPVDAARDGRGVRGPALAGALLRGATPVGGLT